jgi:ferredoxin
MLAQSMALRRRHVRIAGFRVYQKQFVDPLYQMPGNTVVRIQFERLIYLPARMCPTSGAHQLRPACVVVGDVAVGLQNAFELSEKQFRAFPSAPHPEVEDDTSSWRSILPEISLMVFSTLVVRLYTHCRFYYEGLTLQGACRLCLVEAGTTPKLMTACTLNVAEGMVIRTNTPQVAQARKAMLEFVLTNHPLDCPVCDKGGECELQDATLTYGAGESRFEEWKQHVDELQWSPVVYFDRPRCILCYRCVRICDEGMGVGALGVADRACPTRIIPNYNDHLECDECGMCSEFPASVRSGSGLPYFFWKYVARIRRTEVRPTFSWRAISALLTPAR